MKERLKTFETERLILRELKIGNFETLNRILYSDPDICRFFGKVQVFEEVAGQLMFVQESPVGTRVREGYSGDEGFGAWAVVRKNDNQLIGQIHLGPAERAYWIVFEAEPDSLYASFEVELGYAFGKAYWGNGYATEACRPVIEYAFKELRLERLVNHVDNENMRALHLMKRLGFRIEKNLHPDYGGLVGILENHIIREPVIKMFSEERK